MLAVLCAVAIAQACLSSELFIETGPELRYTAGDSTYHISFDEPWALGGHGESELQFPIANVMAGVKVIAGTTYGKNNRKSKGRLCVRLLKTIDKDAGIMKDSDWIENDAAFGKAPHEGKDLYTESDAELEGMLFDAIWAYHFSLGHNWGLGPMLGFRYEELQYEITGTGAITGQNRYTAKEKFSTTKLSMKFPLLASVRRHCSGAKINCYSA